MLWIAHRGYSIDFRDNSVEAIREAVRRGYHGVEIDVQLCKTGEIVLHHDVYLWRCVRQGYDPRPAR
jgi:glycerophosphoryl diester phosphodiesterase